MKVKSAVAALTATVLLAGCASTTIAVRSTNSPSLGSAPAPGVSYSALSINADVTPGAYLGLILLGYLVAGVQNDFQRMSGSASWREAPGLAADRAVAERDCREPLGQIYENLRCK